MLIMKQAKSREDWLKLRQENRRITGSEISAVIGKNPYMTNVDYWEIKTGRRSAPDLSDNELVKYGHDAEEHLRELFRLDFPALEVFYKPDNFWINDRYPFAGASLDSWLEDADKNLGILEIKTATIQSAAQRQKWENGVPDNYYTQVLWYMGVMDAEFAFIAAQLKYERDGDLTKVTKYYEIRRDEVQQDIDFIMTKGEEFWRLYLQPDKRPPLIINF